MIRARAFRLAQLIVNGFDSFFADYLNLTLGAHVRFENAAWLDVHDAQQRRQTLYQQKIAQVVELARTTVDSNLEDPLLWIEVKTKFVPLIENHRNIEVVESFYNSVYCHIFQHRVIRDKYAFADHSTAPVGREVDDNIYRSYSGSIPARELLSQLIEDSGLENNFEDLDRDVDFIQEVIQRDLIPKLPTGATADDVEVQVLRSLFFRNKAAYLVGRTICLGLIYPFVMPILHADDTGNALYVDTLLLDSSDISIVFSFTRTYFMVYTDQPSQYVAFLRSFMPRKPVFEMYAAIGFPKHAKTEFVRYSVRQIKKAQDQFVIAPGIKGMVMLVFTLPSFNYVFKVIKDRFTPPKSMTRDEVKEKYTLVKLHERAGRMADTQEFDNLVFDRRRFSDELLKELRKEVPSVLEENGNILRLRHCYVERRMIPLNLFLPGKNDDEIRDVIDEYGNAIKQMAGANIFPGDMLLKNFGVTRHGRVVFYDYDEICLMEECNFRKIPEPKTEEQAMASTPWYSVADNDVFPEEFRLFFTGNATARKIFEELHDDLYDYRFWKAMQEKIASGTVESVYPYRRIKRFQQR